ncbi:protein translocase subunit secB [Stella humosa]|uniref:Protein-export protein SecB n=1 Tax=Stella humosa TaxID=94 RepID=A0A3N1LP20_9PROT|nr:protein-export chaperone SecB [Stella humosa]ROP90965.1 protein translocase subunit secB [Stella humosa]BBK34685.1 protein-export protein SecB [Stella humosa]
MTDQTPAQAAQGAPVSINAQYIRDLSFENPNAPQIMAELREPPQIEVKVDVKVRALADNVFEVVLSVSASATVAGKNAFVVELEYGSVVTLAAELPQEHFGAILLIEIPRMLFPYARQIIGDATRDGGFPPLLLNPIDFAELYRQQQEAQQQAGPGNGAALA